MNSFAMSTSPKAATMSTSPKAATMSAKTMEKDNSYSKPGSPRKQPGSPRKQPGSPRKLHVGLMESTESNLHFDEISLILERNLTDVKESIAQLTYAISQNVSSLYLPDKLAKSQFGRQPPLIPPTRSHQLALVTTPRRDKDALPTDCFDLHVTPEH